MREYRAQCRNYATVRKVVHTKRLQLILLRDQHSHSHQKKVTLRKESCIRYRQRGKKEDDLCIFQFRSLILSENCVPTKRFQLLKSNFLAKFIRSHRSRGCPARISERPFLDLKRILSHCLDAIIFHVFPRHSAKQSTRLQVCSNLMLFMLYLCLYTLPCMTHLLYTNVHDNDVFLVNEIKLISKCA